VITVMMVCTGNICRSPMAEIVLRERLVREGLDQHVRVDSTGVSDEEAGNPLDPRARRVLTSAGYTDHGLHTHRARQIEPDDIESRDLILTMTTAHARAVRRLADRFAVPVPLDHVRMFRSFDPLAPQAANFQDEYLLDVADPWYGDARAFEECLAQVEAAMDGIVEHLRDVLANPPIRSPHAIQSSDAAPLSNTAPLFDAAQQLDSDPARDDR